MICMIRMDDRLLHGQVALCLESKLGYNAVFMLSDEASKDDVKKAAFEKILCCPSDVAELAIRTVEGRIKIVKKSKT